MSVRPALFLTKYPRRIQVLTSSQLCDSGPLAVEAASTALSRVAATMWAGDQQNVPSPLWAIRLPPGSEAPSTHATLRSPSLRRRRPV